MTDTQIIEYINIVKAHTLENLICLSKKEHIEAHRQLRASEKKEV